LTNPRPDPTGTRLWQRRVFSSFLLEQIPDRVCFKDTTSGFIRVSRAKAERHGISDLAQLIGKTDFEVLTADWVYPCRARCGNYTASTSVTNRREAGVKVRILLSVD
jgi:hypothetical protein